MTLDELNHSLPNGFHDAKILSLELNYVGGTARFHLSLLVGLPENPKPERDAYQEAIMTVTGLCFCTIGPPSSTSPFIPQGKPLLVSGDAAKPDYLPELPDLTAMFPPNTWCYRFFVNDWNSFIYIAAQDAELSWIGLPPKHAD